MGNGGSIEENLDQIARHQGQHSTKSKNWVPDCTTTKENSGGFHLLIEKLEKDCTTTNARRRIPLVQLTKLKMEMDLYFLLSLFWGVTIEWTLPLLFSFVMIEENSQGGRLDFEGDGKPWSTRLRCLDYSARMAGKG